MVAVVAAAVAVGEAAAVGEDVVVAEAAVAVVIKRFLLQWHITETM